MAIAKFGAIITDSRGSIGGTTIRWTRFGHILQNKQNPTLKRSYRQSIARNHFTNFSKMWWAELDATQRDDWRALAAANPRPNRWGTDYPLTGLALFIAINRALVQNGNSPTLSAPADQSVSTLSTATLTVTAPSSASLSFTASPAPADHQVIISASSRTSPGISVWSKTFAFMLASSAAASSPISLSSAFAAKFGDTTPSRQYAVAVRLFNSSNGAYSPPIVASAIAT